MGSETVGRSGNLGGSSGRKVQAQQSAVKNARVVRR